MIFVSFLPSFVFILTHGQQAFGAVAPKAPAADRRFRAVLSAAFVAMALTAVILVATSSSRGDVKAAQWTEFVDPERVALAQALMRGNSALR